MVEMEGRGQKVGGKEENDVKLYYNFKNKNYY